MEDITHFLTGVLIQILFFMYFKFPFNILFTMVFAFLSHFLIDALAKITYHTPEALKGDKFWIIWHIIIYSGSLIILIIFFIPYWLGMLFAKIVDIWDWIILRPIQNKKKKKNPESKWMEKYFFHPIIDKIRKRTLFWLPNWNFKRKGIIPEIIIILFLLATIMFLIYPFP